jgi:type IV secretory pathway VirB10-like protein
MNQTVRMLIFAAIAGAMSMSAALAQSTADPQSNQQNQPAAQTAQSQANQDQSSGVSHPPPDSTIQADEDMNPPPPPATPAAKPSAGIPANAAAAPLPVNRKPVSPSVAAAIVSDAVVPGSSPFSGEVDNTDDGIVTVVPSPRQAAPLQERPTLATDDGIVTSVPVNPNDLHVGTNISVRLAEAISTTGTQPGTPFRATVAHDVFNGSTLVIPAGSEMRGRVAYVSQGSHFGTRATLRLRPDAILLPDGTSYHLYADVVQSQAPGTRTTDEGAIQASNHYKRDGVEYGGTMGTGAVVGAAVGGPVGAGVGTLVGAGMVTTHLLLANPQAAQLPAGSILVFSLTQPMGLTPAKN